MYLRFVVVVLHFLRGMPYSQGNVRKGRAGEYELEFYQLHVFATDTEVRYLGLYISSLKSPTRYFDI